MKKIIGTNTLSYPDKKNFSAYPFKKYKFEKKRNIHTIPAYLYFKTFRKTHLYYWNSFKDYDINKVSLFHFFNCLSFGSTPWITTFETSIPRWGSEEKKILKEGLKLISKTSCKKIIAISECTKNIQISLTDEIAPEYNDVINEKLTVLHPSQICPQNIVLQKNISEKINFTIIGHDFFRKGGKEILIVFDRLYNKGLFNWHLNIISKLDYGDYATKATKEDYKFAKKIINKFSDNISHYEILPNSEVLNILKNTHVGLLPTYADTYGYSVIEAQSFGCPVITTNIRAMPEINNSKKGWIIKVNKDSFKNAKLNTKKERMNFSINLTDQLEFIIIDILNSQYDLVEMARICVEDLKNSVSHNTKTLEKLYDKISTI